jgi:hypothetical protein
MRGISAEYAKLNSALHETNPAYGTSSSKWVEHVRMLAQAFGCRSILDYGAGKGLLAREIPLVVNYDPAIQEWAAAPKPSDLVVCTDVLEHVEPEYLNEVLDHLSELTRNVIFLTVATRPARKILEDGRNAHLIVEQSEWWLPRIMERFRVREFRDGPGEFLVIAEPRHEH